MTMEQPQTENSGYGGMSAVDRCVRAPAPTAVQEITRLRGLMLWTLYHHQGASSEIGQPIRRALGIGQYDRMTAEQIATGKTAAGMPANDQGKRTQAAGQSPDA